jgi:hypothetical protein
MKDRKSSGMALLLLDTHLKSRSDDDRKWKSGVGAESCRQRGGRSAATRPRTTHHDEGIWLHYSLFYYYLLIIVNRHHHPSYTLVNCDIILM